MDPIKTVFYRTADFRETALDELFQVFRGLLLPYFDVPRTPVPDFIDGPLVFSEQRDRGERATAINHSLFGVRHAFYIY